MKSFNISTDQILSALNWRYAVKKFDATQKISAEHWQALKESLRLAPSSYGLQAWKFIEVQNPELRQKLKAHSWNQDQVTDASHFVVFAYRPKVTETDVDRYLKSTAQIRNIPFESLKGFRDVIIGDVVTGPRAETAHIWTQRQTYIAMGFLLETAALLGIDACPMEGLNPAEYDQILGLKDSGWATVAAVALGYRHAQDNYQNLPKSRLPMEDVFEIKN